MADVIATEALETLRWLVEKGEVIIRKSPLLDGRIQVLWEAHRNARAGSISGSLEEALVTVASELKKKEAIEN